MSFRQASLSAKSRKVKSTIEGVIEVEKSKHIDFC